MQHNWQKIYLNYSPKLLGICRRYIPDIYTAEDIVHDSFIIAIQKNDQLNDEKALFAWLKKIVINNALQHIRKHSKDTFVSTEPSEIPDTRSEMEHHLLEEKNVFIYDFTNEELLLSIDNLPPHHKSVFNLYFIENYSHAEISGLLGITVNTSKSHLLRAKKSVQNYLLNNVVNKNTPKKKMAQLFVLFGFGGLLWAQTFQNKFSDFKIQPSKKLEISSDIKSSSFSISKDNAWKKLIIGVTFLVIVAGTVFLLKPQKSFSIIKDNSSVKSFSVTENQYKTNKTGHQEKQDSNDSHTKRVSDLKTIEISSEKTGQSPLTDQTAEEVKSLKNKQDLKKIMIKDSLDEVPQKVIVVKKIIRRDTVFIEK